MIQTGMVTAGFFPTLAIAPALGRAFTAAEEAQDAHLLVLTDRLWRAQFAADPAAVGHKVFLNEEPFTVIGVMPPGFEYPKNVVLPDAFFPLEPARLLLRAAGIAERRGPSEAECRPAIGTALGTGSHRRATCRRISRHESRP